MVHKYRYLQNYIVIRTHCDIPLHFFLSFKEQRSSMPVESASMESQELRPR